jgi:hypothetical protein
MAQTNIPKGGKLQPIPRGARLEEDMKRKLKVHAAKHDHKHIASMRMSILKGKSFQEAHKKALARKPK